jgi:hypothetical protein
MPLSAATISPFRSWVLLAVSLADGLEALHVLAIVEEWRSIATESCLKLRSRGVGCQPERLVIDSFLNASIPDCTAEPATDSLERVNHDFVGHRFESFPGRVVFDVAPAVPDSSVLRPTRQSRG